jgi:MFS family permease
MVSERRPPLILVVGTVVFVDTLLYAVLAPLLPGLAHELRLSKLSAGLLTASYPIGTLVGSLPGALLVLRAGPRFTVLTGLTLLLCSTVAFALLQDAAALDSARFVEGLGGACSWTGGLAWIVVQAADSRRGAMLGRVIGAAVAGALFGPALGTLASAIGRPAAFSGLAIVVGLVIVWARRTPARRYASGQRLRNALAALRSRDVAFGMWLVTLPAIASGTINVLGPLRFHELGGDAVAIGATFLLAAAIEAALAPAIGGLSDRHGRLLPLRFGLGGATAALLCFTLPRDVVALAVVIMLTAATMGLFWTPAMAMLADAAQAHGLDQGLAAALMNVAWAGGQIIGSGGGGAVARATSDAVPIAITAGLCATTLVALVLWGVQPELVGGPEDV